MVPGSPVKIELRKKNLVFYRVKKSNSTVIIEDRVGLANPFIISQEVKMEREVTRKLTTLQSGGK